MIGRNLNIFPPALLLDIALSFIFHVRKDLPGKLGDGGKKRDGRPVASTFDVERDETKKETDFHSCVYCSVTRSVHFSIPSRRFPSNLREFLYFLSLSLARINYNIYILPYRDNFTSISS